MSFDLHGTTLIELAVCYLKRVGRVGCDQCLHFSVNTFHIRLLFIRNYKLIAARFDHNEKDDGICTFYQNALRASRIND